MSRYKSWQHSKGSHDSFVFLPRLHASQLPRAPKSHILKCFYSFYCHRRTRVVKRQLWLTNSASTSLSTRRTRKSALLVIAPSWVTGILSTASNSFLLFPSKQTSLFLSTFSISDFVNVGFSLNFQERAVHGFGTGWKGGNQLSLCHLVEEPQATRTATSGVDREREDLARPTLRMPRSTQAPLDFESVSHNAFWNYREKT